LSSGITRINPSTNFAISISSFYLIGLLSNYSYLKINVKNIRLFSLNVDLKQDKNKKDLLTDPFLRGVEGLKRVR
jgi:hypothetical protein